MADALQELQKLRDLRQWRQRDLSIRSLLEETGRQARRTHDHLGDIIDLWQELVPGPLRGHTGVTGFDRGVLRVNVSSASVRYELDRALREGLLAALRSRSRLPIARVRTELAGRR